MAESTASQLFHQLIPAHEEPHAKVTVVGVGQVGMACAFSMLVQDVCSELCLVDVIPDKLRGEMLDLQHGLPFIRNCTIKADTDYKITSGSKICVITAGARQREGETRLDLVQRNTEIFKGIVPQLVKYSPNTIILVVSNPVDILTYVAWKLSGLPKERVIGSGTNLDSARFRFLIHERLNVAPTSCHGWIIGEHGDSSVAVWSGVNVAGVRLKDINPKIGDPDDPEKWGEVHRKVIDSAYEIIRLKGYTSWAIGMCVSSLCRAVLRNVRSIHALSVCIQGVHGIDKEVYLSVPCVLGETGITHIVQQKLNATEQAQLKKSADMLLEVQQGIKF